MSDDARPSREVPPSTAPAESSTRSDGAPSEDAASASPVTRVPRHRAPDDAPVIPERSADDSDLGWGDGPDSNDDRLRRDVPPHW
jgi:hypothetical protein